VVILHKNNNNNNNNNKNNLFFSKCADHLLTYSALPNNVLIYIQVKYLTKHLKTRESFLLGDTVARAFFSALVLLIGQNTLISA